MNKFERGNLELKEQLKAVLSSHTQLLEEFTSLKNELKRKDQIVEALQKRLYGSSSERLDPLQDDLPFGEGDNLLGKFEPVEEDVENEGELAEDPNQSNSQPRRRREKKDLFPRNLPVLSEEVIIPQEVLDDPEAFLSQSKLGKAITYAFGRWNELKTYLDDARVPIDNNLIENAIRPAKLGLKNYMFFGSAEAGKNNALLYTLIANCKAAQINPEFYFEEVFRRLPINAPPEQAAELTPEKLALEIQSQEELRQIA